MPMRRRPLPHQSMRGEKRMKSLVLLAALAATCLCAGTAVAADPPAQTEPSPSVATVVDAPKPISYLLVPRGGIGTFPTRLAGPVVGRPGTTTADCGACIVTCWA